MSMPTMLAVPNRHIRAARGLRRWSTRATCLLVVALLSACSLATLGGRGAPHGTLSLIVENRGYFDVNVFVVRSEGTRGARLGTANGGTTVTFKVRDTDLQAGGLLQLQARAIGGRSTWLSPTLTVGTGMVIKLDINATGTTDLSQSQLYIIQ
jgi:hypothetical protein